MKKDIHPPYHTLRLKIGNDFFDTRSTLGGEILVEIDYRQHKAWNKESGQTYNAHNKNVSAFTSRYGNLFGSKKPATQENQKQV